MGKLLVATETFRAVVNGFSDLIEEGTHLDEDHEAVRANRDKFRSVERTRPDVEDASADPGRKRGAK